MHDFIEFHFISYSKVVVAQLVGDVTLFSTVVDFNYQQEKLCWGSEELDSGVDSVFTKIMNLDDSFIFVQ